MQKFLLHKHCAGLSRLAFSNASKSGKPFYCAQCRLDKQEMELSSLQDVVSCQLSAVKEELAATKSLLSQNLGSADLSPALPKASQISQPSLHALYSDITSPVSTNPPCRGS